MFTASSFIPGATVVATSHTDFKRPRDGVVIGCIGEAGPDGVDAAVTSAGETFRAHRKTPLATRVAWLKAAAKAIPDNPGGVAPPCRGMWRKADPHGAVRGQPRRGVHRGLRRGCAAAEGRGAV